MHDRLLVTNKQKQLCYYNLNICTSFYVQSEPKILKVVLQSQDLFPNKPKEKSSYLYSYPQS